MLQKWSSDRVIESTIAVLTPIEQFVSYSMARTSCIQGNVGRHVAPLGHIIPIPSQLVFDTTH
jgi:hypothetical protein